MAQPASSVSLATLLRTVVLVSLPALLVLSLLAFLGLIEGRSFLYSYAAVLVLSALLIHPLLRDLSRLTIYVRELSEDKKVDAPGLGVLSTVGELSGALRELQESWEKKKREMESSIVERNVLVDTLPDMLIMVNDAQTIVRTNRAARNVFGQNLARKALRDVVPSEELCETVAAVVRDLKGRQVEFYIESPGPYHFLAVIERFPGPSRKGISTIIALNDITERRRLEQMRADFVANASHEIRTPLASIRGFIETLQGPAKEDAKAREEFLGIMSEQAERMGQLIGDLLSLSKIETSSHSVPCGKVDVPRLLRTEVQSLIRQAEGKRMTVRVDAPDTLPLARGEENELRQVVHNLISNAVKYGHAETEVLVTARATTRIPPDVPMQGASRALYVSVKDRGDGIPREHLPRLTERFYRVDSARTRAVGGTGLGLAIVKHILNRHQGALTIDSVVGEGSVFTFFVPVWEE